MNTIIKNSVFLVLSISMLTMNAYAGKACKAYKDEIYPPWQGEKNNPALDKGIIFTVPQVDNLPDFHGDPINPKLVIYVGGNYFFAMADLVKAFEKKNPALRGKIYYETIPPGVLEKQLKNGGTITVGNMTWTSKPDVYAAGKNRVESMIASGDLKGPQINYVTNDLTIMIPKANPAQIKGLEDLGRPDVRVVMPNPATEGIARQAEKSLVKAGGEKLAKTVYKTKVNEGKTILTTIHHRQSPLFILQGLADGGVTWRSEAIFQEKVGNPISAVEIPEAQNTRAVYSAAMAKDATHPEAAGLWLAFLKSKEALRIFESYGFKAYTEDKD